jgi:hypothetical protein
MCFSQPGSLAFALLGLGTAALLKARGHPFRRYGLFLYFALMEVIQFNVSSRTRGTDTLTLSVSSKQQSTGLPHGQWPREQLGSYLVLFKIVTGHK